MSQTLVHPSMLLNTPVRSGVKNLTGQNNAVTPNTQYDFSADEVVLTATNGNAPAIALPWRIGDAHIVRIGDYWWACYKEDPATGRFGLARAADPHNVFTEVMTWNSGVTKPNVPLWLLDEDGPHIVVEQDDTRQLFEMHPLTQDQSQWVDPNNWSRPVAITDFRGDDLSDIGNFGLVKIDATYYLVYNQYPTGEFFTRVSDALMTGWSDASSFESPVPDMDECLGLVVLDDGNLRFYFHQNFGPAHFAIDTVTLPTKDSAGVWGAPQPLSYAGFTGDLDGTFGWFAFSRSGPATE